MVHAIKDRLDIVQEEISVACQRAGRSTDELTLIAVTKTFPAAVVEAGIEAGLEDFGENKSQELVSKASAVSKDACRWHMIGHLQRNKARHVIEHAHSFHALDSARLAATLDRLAQAANRILPCFVQVNISREATKSGLDAGQVGQFLEEMSRYPNLELTGLMTLAAWSTDSEVVRQQFRQMRQLRDRYQHLGCSALSMGMTSDYVVAIEEGATHLRVGSAIFGPRVRKA